MITIADLVAKTGAFMTNPGKINAELTKKQKVRNSPLILSSLERYLYIKEHYDDGTFITDPNFQAVYLDFYQIRENTHVTSAFIHEYFKLLEESKRWGVKWNEHSMHGYVAARLESYKTPKGKQSYQYSFISKLLHTANNELPIYDQNVWEVVEGTGKPAGTPKMPYAKRINCGVSTLDDIGDLYKGLYYDYTFNRLLDTVTCLNGHSVSFVKKCDFIFWVMGDFELKTKKVGSKSGKTSVKGSATGKSAGVKSGVAANTLDNSTGEADSEKNTN